jgi:membrane-anchored protein YejM (alkaline phosphatase superfamily)
MTRRRILRWAGWFAIANAGLCFLIGLRYLFHYQWPDSALGIVYAPLAMLGNFTVLIVLAATLVLGPLIALGPMRRTVMSVAVVCAALAVAFLVLDINVYAERRLHLSMLIAVLFEPVTWLAAGLVFAAALALEAALAGMLWRWLERRPAAGGRWIGAALASGWIASQALHLWADAVGYAPVTRFTQVVPLYYPMDAKRRLARLGLVDPERVRQESLLRRGTAVDAGELHYPLAPLRCEPSAPLPNVLWIVIDALRADAIDATLTPTLQGLRARSQDFDNHWSAGNSSRMAAFGMFYGLPSTYFQSFYAAERAPVLFDQFRAAGYEIHAAGAKGFGAPLEMDRTALAGVPEMVTAEKLPRVEGNDRVARDMAGWLAGRRGPQPFFGLLWFDHSDFDIGPAGSVLPADGRYAGNPQARTRWDHYRRGLRVIDGQLARVLEALGRAAQAGGTIVLVTGDHGFEFDDLGLGYYGHASNFARWQLRVPLLIRWPGREPRRFTHRSSHLDLPATLLQEVFGCRNDPADYGMGRNLFAGVSWDWIIAGSYHSFAIVEPDRVIVSEPGGLVRVLGEDYREPEYAGLDAARIEQAFDAMQRFYQ